MREKTLRLIISFHTTTAAMAMEKYCLANSLPGRLIPLPREISAGCGMAWSAPVQARGELLLAADAAGIDVDKAVELMV